MLYVCYSGFHWMLISGLMGLPTLLVTSFIHLEFSLESNPGKKPRNGEWETEWWICACWGVKIALRFQGGLIFTFFWCSVLLLCPVPEGSLLETGKHSAWSFYPTVPFTSIGSSLSTLQKEAEQSSCAASGWSLGWDFSFMSHCQTGGDRWGAF